MHQTRKCLLPPHSKPSPSADENRRTTKVKFTWRGGGVSNHQMPQKAATYRSWKKPSAVTHRHTVLQQTNPERSSIDQHLIMFRFYENFTDKQLFCGHNTLAEGVFVTQLSSNTGIFVWRILWVTTNCRFMSNKLPKHWVHTLCQAKFVFQAIAVEGSISASLHATQSPTVVYATRFCPACREYCP
jgi:hypothetical protein